MIKKADTTDSRVCFFKCKMKNAECKIAGE